MIVQFFLYEAKGWRGGGRGRETVTVKPVLSGTVFLMANLESFQVV